MSTRREWLIGAGAAALATATVTGRTKGIAAESDRRGPARRLLAVQMYGGWDTCYALDPKEPAFVDVPAGATRRFLGLDVFTHESRPGVTALFERHRELISVVRGISTDAINHPECMVRMATGTRQGTSPDVAAMVADGAGRDAPVPYLVLADVAFSGPYGALTARVGASNQLAELVATPSNPGVTPPTAAERDLLERYARASAARARATRGAHGANRRRVDDFERSLERAGRLRALGGFGPRGEAQSFDAQIEVALDALEQDVAHAVMMSTRMSWDTHFGNAAQGLLHDLSFTALAHLLDELRRRPGRVAGSKMIDDTVVLCISDLGRTPRLNEHGGKEHWPVTAAMLMGAGIAGGKVVGATTADAQAVAIDLATGLPAPAGVKPMYSHLIAGVLAQCGLDPAEHLDAAPLRAFAS